ncbi:hypothetical protein O9K51_08138 [Purpureocillium lavendulum]|uniref:Uncharacterized protein n=1 Tax=Purpureocillium lavendulum TaxID=1247861 RepID=A0AB34FJU2_9HYPO|nr:hypothetical protein O9K51_08138 [Purpureocillium lavendulum]
MADGTPNALIQKSPVWLLEDANLILRRPFKMKISMFATLTAIAGIAAAAPVAETVESGADADALFIVPNWGGKRDANDAGTDGGIYFPANWGTKREESSADVDYRKIWRKEATNSDTKSEAQGADVDYKKIW